MSLWHTPSVMTRVHKFLTPQIFCIWICGHEGANPPAGIVADDHEPTRLLQWTPVMYLCVVEHRLLLSSFIIWPTPLHPFNFALKLDLEWSSNAELVDKLLEMREIAKECMRWKLWYMELNAHYLMICEVEIKRCHVSKILDRNFDSCS